MDASKHENSGNTTLREELFKSINSHSTFHMYTRYINGIFNAHRLFVNTGGNLRKNNGSIEMDKYKLYYFRFVYLLRRIEPLKLTTKLNMYQI